jgi:formylglycine-generating enzyme required for sulfatase activity
LATYAADDPPLLVELLSTADERQFSVLFPPLVKHGQAAALVEMALDASLHVKPADWDDDTPEQASANLAIALVRLGRPERLWPLLVHSPDPTLRTRLIDRLLPLGAPLAQVAARLAVETDASSRRALILALGEAAPAKIPSPLHGELVARLADLHADDPDTGVFAAAEWTLRQWGEGERIVALRQSLSRDPNSPLGRFVTSQGQVMTVVRGPVEFVMGAPPEETGRFASGEKQVTVRIERSFAVALHELTREEYLRFENDPAIVQERKGQNIWHNENWSRTYGPDLNCPHVALPWSVAARYCRWLSEQEGLPKEELCFPIVKSTGESMTLPADYLDRTGYRLPTAAEWEYVCRAGASTIRFFGRGSAQLDRYAWFMPKSQQRSWPAGMLRPNDFGLFDIQGNVREQCFNRSGYRPAAREGGIALDDEEANLTIDSQQDMQTCGGCYNDAPRFIRSASRETGQEATSGSNLNGMRLVRTIRLGE